MKHLTLFLRVFLVLSAGARLGAATFTSAGPITFANLGADRRSSPYPSTITASGIAAGSISSVTITLNNLTHARPDDIEILLVSPWGAKLVVLADAGGASTPVSGVNLTLDDAAANLVPDAGPMTSGTFRPTCVDNLNNIATEFPGVTVTDPADTATPSGSATFTSVFGGSHDPNGTWSLYIVDDVTSTDNATLGSWSISITTSVAVVGTTTTVGAAPNPSTTGSSVTFTATVLKQSDSSPVTTGTVNFKEGTSSLSGAIAVNGSGQAAFPYSSLSEGDHTITAEYNPGSGFLASSGAVSQRVDNATQQSGNAFSNTGTLSLATSGSGVAQVYPSHIFVSGLSGAISQLTLKATGISIDRPDDLELLLVGPGGQNFLVLSDAGGTVTPLAGVDLTFDDAAGSQVPDATAPATGTYRPTSHGPSSMPAPAPAGPYSQPAPQGSATFANIFAGTSPNGTWSLFALDDVAGAGGQIAGGWSLTFTTTSDASTSTEVDSTPNPSVSGTPVTFTATVTSSGVPVSVGSVTFREGTAVLAGPTALDGAGQASFPISSLTEGNHIISADYGGSPGAFNLSTGSTSQSVENPTIILGSSFCNQGTMTISATSPAVATAYPSHVTVTGIGGPITKVTLSLAGVSVDRPDDLEFLLVGPTGASFVVLGDAGGTASPVNGINLTFDDAAANLIPDAGPLASGTFKPTSVNSSAAGFPSPAPAGPYSHPGPFGTATFASVFNGSPPLGSWSLYAMDDVPGGGATVSGGWCLTLDTDEPPVAVTDEVTRDKNRPVKVPIATLLANDTDSEGVTPTFVSVAATSANGASVHALGIWIEYDAIPGNNADDSFTYTISDGVSSSTGTVNVKVARPDAETSNLSIKTSGADKVIGVSGIPGRVYQLQSTTALSSPIVWTGLGPPLTADAAGRASYTDVSPPSPRFYRAIEP